jgi:hypothetical protein
LNVQSASARASRTRLADSPGAASRVVQPLKPYLEGELQRRFDRWLADVVARHSPPLTFPELRKGVRALSSLYVERRAAGPIAPRVRDGQAKRAAFATYYAALHFLTAHHALLRIGPERLGEVRRIHDLGCGTAAAGAALAAALPEPPEVNASDSASWVLPEARRTLAAFGIPATVRRANLRAALRRARSGDLALLAWVVNELDAPAREEIEHSLCDAIGRGCRVLVLEPLAGGVSPWWPDWSRRFRAEGLREEQVKLRVVLPAWIAKMDRASGLDHAALGARILAGPLDSRPLALRPVTDLS